MPAPKITPETRAMGRRLANVRTEQGLTQQQVAERIGMSAVGYANKETGRAAISTTDIPRLAGGLGVSRAFLVRRLGLIEDESEPLTPEEQAEWDAAMTDPDVRYEFATTARSMRDWTDDEKRALLEVMRQMRDVIDRKRGR